MKIALLGPTPPFRGGIVQFAVSLAAEFRRQGHEVRLFGFIRQYPALIFPGGSQTADDTMLAQLPVERVFTPYQPWTWRMAVKRINRWQPDQVIISYWLPFMAPAYGWIARRIKAAGIRYLVHNIEFHEKWLFADALSRYALKPAERVILLSQSSYDAMRRVHPQIPSEMLIKGFHPVYDIYRQREEVDSGNRAKSGEQRPPTLLFFGLIKPYKGLDILIRAFAMARDRMPDLHLIIAGDVYGNADQYRDLIAEQGIAESVETYFSYIADHEVKGFFHRADVCVLPYRSATQSGIVQLSYAFEVPVIASDVGGIGEYVKVGETGLLVPAEDPAALAEAICAFTISADKAGMRDGIRRFNRDHGWDKLAALVTSQDGLDG